ncbi:MAG: DUF4340 domain-containing protein [Methylotenera sp.]|nr:DUF4340 domain-containing protein [Oligoflexia bacterium]
MTLFRFRKFTQPSLPVVVLAIAASLSNGCTSRNEPPSGVNPASGGLGTTSELKLNAPLFSFSHEQARELNLIKNDPASGDHWTARIINSGSAEKPDWKIASSSMDLIDVRADGPYIVHLLDTLRTLQAFELAPEGPLSSFGLTTPLFALRWLAPNSNGQMTENEIHLGDSNLKAGGIYACLPARSGAVSHPQVFLVRGAALEMLTHLARFEALRLRKLVTFETAELDSIALKGPGIQWSVLRAKDTWQEAPSRRALHDPVNFQRRLEGLTHLRILRFIDDARENTALKKAFEETKVSRAFFTLRQNGSQPITLKVRQNQGKTHAWISTRPDATFEVYSDILKFFKPLTQL